MSGITTRWKTRDRRSVARARAAARAAASAQIAHAKAQCAPAFARIARARRRPGGRSRSREALAQLPVMRKSELAELQNARRARSAASQRRDGAARAARLRVARARSTSPKAPRPTTGGSRARSSPRGFRAGDLVHNCFSYHFTPAGSMLETGAHALGCTVFPGGTGQTEQQVAAMADLQPAGYVGTPSFLRIILERPTSSA